MKIYTVKVGTNGDKHWYQNGKLHCTHGPAIECVNGDKHWYQNGKLHCTHGPAAEYANGDEYWYIEGKEYTKGEFDAIVNAPKVKELTMSEISKLLGYEVKVVTGS